jgi:hypothetical protein
MHKIITIIAALALAMPLAAAPQKLDPAQAFAVCDEAERRTRTIMLRWQMAMPRSDALALTKGNAAFEAVVADLYDYAGPPRGRTKEAFLRKWHERCLAHPEAFVIPNN